MYKDMFFKFLIKIWMCKVQFLASNNITYYTIKLLFIILRLGKFSTRYWSACCCD